MAEERLVNRRLAAILAWGAWTDLAAAYAWRGQKAEAAAAVAELLKVRPGFTVEQLAQDANRQQARARTTR